MRPARASGLTRKDGSPSHVPSLSFAHTFGTLAGSPRDLPGADRCRVAPVRRAPGGLTTVSGGTVEVVADGPRHAPRSRPSPFRARGGLLSRPSASHPRTSVRWTDNSAAVILPAVLEERARIARELHDSVSQTLYAITLGAARARALLQQNE
ncbi:MAG: hypothetical protein JO023_05430, partial [Chloroflexi bacterium]|nr:hypothetical protein [Chloroflexota bacterium]